MGTSGPTHDRERGRERTGWYAAATEGGTPEERLILLGLS
jgi:hypothetical protein